MDITNINIAARCVRNILYMITLTNMTSDALFHVMCNKFNGVFIFKVRVG
jgi:hypothetical protein